MTGRDLKRVLQGIEEYSLPTPDYIVADVGASIYSLKAGRWTLHGDWESRLALSWGNIGSMKVHSVLEDMHDLISQEDSRQRYFKRSYYFPEDADKIILCRDVQALLAQSNMPASLVVSHDPEKSVGLLDVLPADANKA